nr:MAG TPA: hypothetical protein [Bacteriophage sp.]
MLKTLENKVITSYFYLNKISHITFSRKCIHLLKKLIIQGILGMFFLFLHQFLHQF